MAETIKEKIERLADENSDQLINYCTRLINKESITGNESAVQNEVRSIMEELNLNIDFWIPEDEELRNSDLYRETGESFKNRPVVAGILKGLGKGKGRSMMINGHVDVVTPNPLEKWITDPFQSKVEGGKIFGRGASDMKSGIAMALFSIYILKKTGHTLDGDITLVCVPGEENGGNGTVASVLRGYTKADGLIIPEPTSNRIQPAHRGAAFWRIHIQGKASHGGTKYKGVSAVEKGMIIAEGLAKLERWRDENICKKHPLYQQYPISAPVTLGIFNGGQFSSGVPETCMLEGCIEYVPGETSDDVISMFEETIYNISQSDEWMKKHNPEIEWFGLRYEPSETDVNQPFVKEMITSYQEMLGEEPVVNGFEAGTDMRIITNNFEIPGLMFGPGDITMAHAPNEYVRVDDLIKGAKVLTLMLAKWCELQ